MLSLLGQLNFPIYINWENIEGVDEFEYLRRVVFSNGDTELNVARRVFSDCSAFVARVEIIP